MRDYGQFPGDDKRSACFRGPEIIAAEQRILTYADALLTWMRQVDMKGELPLKFVEQMSRFFTHESKYNPATKPLVYDEGETKVWMLEKLDPDANRFFMDLLRAAWEVRCWKVRYGEITQEERDRL